VDKTDKYRLPWQLTQSRFFEPKKDKGSPYSITVRRVPELIPVLGSQSAGDVNHKQLHQQPLRGLLPTLAKGAMPPQDARGDKVTLSTKDFSVQFYTKCAV